MCNNSKFITVNKYSKLRYFNLSFILKDLFSEINPIIELKAHKNSDSVLIYQINSFMPKNVLDMFKDAVKYKKSKKSKPDPVFLYGLRAADHCNRQQKERAEPPTEPTGTGCTPRFRDRNAVSADLRTSGVFSAGKAPNVPENCYLCRKQTLFTLWNSKEPFTKYCP